MSDRTMIALGRASISVPRIAKRALQVLTAVGMTAMVALVVIVMNSLLMAHGGFVPGFDAWYGFIRRPDIIATMVLTAVVTVGYLFWEKRSDKR